MSNETMLLLVVVALCAGTAMIVAAWRYNEKHYKETPIVPITSDTTQRISDKPMRIHYPIGH